MTTRSTGGRNAGGKPRAQTTVKRGRPAASRAPRRSPRVPMTTRLFARLPFAPATIRRAITGVALVGIATVTWIGASVTGVTAWAGDEIAAAVGRAGFEVKRIEVVGANRIDRLQVYDIVLRERDRSMAAVDLDAVREGLLSYGWVGDARISRRLPDTLVVELVERSPVAVWQRRGQLSLIDARGTVLDDADIAAAEGLPVIVGTGANQQMASLATLLETAPALRPQLAGASWVGNRRWDLRFHSGEILALPEGEEAAIRAFGDFARMDGINRLLGRGIVRFDMRDGDRLVLRPARDGAVRDAQAARGEAAAAVGDGA